MGIEIGDVWTTRVFKDPDPKLRVFKIAVFLGLSVGVIDQEDSRHGPGKIERVIWFAKSDLQFMDLLQRGAPKNAEGKD